MLPATLAVLLSIALPALDPEDLRRELDSAAWRPAPVLAPVAPEAATPAASTAPAPASPAAAAAPATARAPSPPTAPQAASAALWQLQLGALSNAAKARAEKTRLEAVLGPGTVELVTESGLTKLRWGRFPTREAAEAARSDLQARNLEGFPVQRR